MNNANLKKIQESGIMMYCFQHHRGCLILGQSLPTQLYKSCCSTHDTGCSWEDVGTFKLHEGGIVTFNGPIDEWYEELGSKWKTSDYLTNIYNKNMENIVLPKIHGIVLHCFEHNKSCYILSKKVPNIGLDYLCKESNKKNSCCEWEDVGTFHIENNKIIHHDMITDCTIQDRIVYDSNLQKININS